MFRAALPVATVLNRVSFFYYAKNGRLISTAKKGRELVLIHCCFISFPLFAVGISLPFLILTDPGLQRSVTLLHWFVVVVLPILEDISFLLLLLHFNLFIFI